MEVLFLVSLAIFCMIEAYMVVQYVRKRTPGRARYTAVPAVLFLAFLLVLHLAHISIPYMALILPMAAVFVHTYFGYYLDLYRLSKIFDRYLHGFGTFSAALLFYLTLSKVTEPGGSVLFRAIFVAALGIAIGAVFEVIEFIHDSRCKVKMQRGLKDTDVDIICDIIGAVAAAIAASFLFL